MGHAAPAAIPRKSIPAKSAPRLPFLLKAPEHTYVMSQGSHELNFTAVEILTLLPNWVKNEDIAARFMNNGLDSGVHIAMLEENQGLNIPTNEIPRVKDGITALYRRAMRKTNSTWKKVDHKAPDNWDPRSISVDQFVPDEIRKNGAKAQQPSIAFSDLANGIKRLPQGANAGDLTHALEYALSNEKPSPYHGVTTDWMFPDDIHTILQQQGYITVTDDHSDRAAFKRYDLPTKVAVKVDRKRRYEGNNATLAASAKPLKRRNIAPEEVPQRFVPSSPLPSVEELRKSPFWQHQDIPAVVVHSPQSDHMTSFQHQFQVVPPQAAWPTPVPAFHHYNFHPQQMVCNSTPTPLQPQVLQAQALPSSTAFPTTFFDFDAFEATIADNQDFNWSHTLTASPMVDLTDETYTDVQFPTMPSIQGPYEPTQLLMQCAEGDDAEDHSDIARAARFCRDLENGAMYYKFRDLDFVVTLCNMSEDAVRYEQQAAQA
ncbi:hypothetical protein DE146DRAFT_621523 [Phaeosphaeria sp. MPI-PUGE-AT-0046c]|nr:hypothetical protein DE146DRAFT_621523 [Phaeosphaeria sp. MPI-PUGE-AT-0046c]